MMMRLVQIIDNQGQRRVAKVEGALLVLLSGVATIRNLALAAIASSAPIEALVGELLSAETLDYDIVQNSGRLLLPIDHDDPYRMLITGTGLTHIGSATLRSNMHGEDPAQGMTDSAKLFRAGVENGKPPAGQIGVEPEWFFKGTGLDALRSGEHLVAPFHGTSIGEEAELAGVYIVGPDGTPYRIGFTVANDVSDHAFERRNYMYIAASKLRPCPIGPELFIGALPDSVIGTVRIMRDDTVIWESPFASGEAHMSHSIANLEYHHFKAASARRPGDVHLHLFGCDASSGAAGVAIQDGDIFEIDAPVMGRPLRNEVRFEAPQSVTVKCL
jgi:hypothetical protein